MNLKKTILFGTIFTFSQAWGQEPPALQALVQKENPRRVLVLTVNYDTRTKKVHSTDASVYWTPKIAGVTFNSYYRAEMLTRSGKWVQSSVNTSSPLDMHSGYLNPIINNKIFVMTDEDCVGYRLIETASGKVIGEETFPIRAHMGAITASYDPKQGILFTLQDEPNGTAVYWSTDGALWEWESIGYLNNTIFVHDIIKDIKNQDLLFEVQWFDHLILFRRRFLFTAGGKIQEIKEVPPMMLRRDWLDQVLAERRSNKE